MADNINERLFDEFPPVSTEQWEKVIEADLKGADYDKKLVWRTAEGFSVRPYYRAEDLARVPFADSRPGVFPFVRGTGTSGDWRVHQTVRVDDPHAANAETHEQWQKRKILWAVRKMRDCGELLTVYKVRHAANIEDSERKLDGFITECILNSER